MDRWRAIVDTVINIWFHQMRGISSPPDDLLASQKGLCSMEFICLLFVCLLVGWLVCLLVGWLVDWLLS
jgi:hypothetical protein